MISRIRDNLYICALRDLSSKMLMATGVTTILNVASEISTPPLKVNIEKYGFADNAFEAKKLGPLAARRLTELLEAMEIVAVHCKAGASRSPHVVALALSEIENRDYYDVFEEIKQLHPRTFYIAMQQEIDRLG